MSRIWTFKFLVITATVCYFVWFLLPYGASEFDQKIESYSGYGAVLPIRHPLYYGTWLALSLIAAVGLFFTQNWARHLYLALALLVCVLAPFSGYSIAPPLDTMFANANLLLSGAVLAVAYLSPLSDGFNEVARNKKKKRDNARKKSNA
jgi:hypothetical protein